MEKRGHIYFVPFTYGTDFWMACEVCKVGFELTPAESDVAKEVIKMIEDARKGKISSDEATKFIAEAKLFDPERTVQLKRLA